MPAFCTHYLFGEDFIANLPEEKKHNRQFRAAFFYGVQGPDFMLFHRALPTMPGKSLSKISTRMHSESPVELFELLKTLAQLNKTNPVVQGYVAGFVCHYALDRCAHPYVNFLTKGIIGRENIKYNPAVVHNRIETNLDRFMLKKRFKINDPRQFHPSEILSGSKKLIGDISSIMTKIINSLYDENVSQKQVEAAFRDFRKIQDMLSDSTYWRKPLSKILELPLRFKHGPALSTLIRGGRFKTDLDYANEGANPWMNIDKKGRTHNETFFQIYDFALADAMNMYQKLLEGKSAEEITNGITFKTGTRVKDDKPQKAEEKETEKEKSTEENPKED